MSATGYLGLLDLGVRSAVTRYVAQFHAKAEDASASRVVSSALIIFLRAAAIAVISSVLIAFFVVAHFKIPQAYQFVAKLVVILTGVSVAISLVTGVFGGILAALQRFDISNYLEIGSTVVRAAAIVLLLVHGRGLISLAVLQVAIGIAAGFGYSLLAFRLYPSLRIDLRKHDADDLKLIFSFSVYSFVLQISVYLIFYTDSVIISVFLPISFVTFFAIAGNLMNYSRGILSGISTTVTPLASALEAEGRTRDLGAVLLKGSRLASMVFLPIGITFLIRGRSFIAVWMGPSYAQLSGEVLAILSVAQLVMAGNYVPTSMAIGISRHKGVVPIVLLEGVSNLVLSVLLIRSHGLIGVALGTALPSLVTQLAFWPWYIHRTFGIRPLTYALSTWIRPGLAALPYAIGTYLVEKNWTPTSLFVFFIQILVVLPMVLLPFWFFCMTREERDDYAGRIRLPLLSS